MTELMPSAKPCSSPVSGLRSPVSSRIAALALRSHPTTLSGAVSFGAKWEEEPVSEAAAKEPARPTRRDLPTALKCY